MPVLLLWLRILSGSPLVVAQGRQYIIEDKPAVILCTYINRHAGRYTKPEAKSYDEPRYNSIIYVISGTGFGTGFKNW